MLAWVANATSRQCKKPKRNMLNEALKEMAICLEADRKQAIY
jgi:histidinol phosphatase-like enzyme